MSKSQHDCESEYKLSAARRQHKEIDKDEYEEEPPRKKLLEIKSTLVLGSDNDGILNDNLAIPGKGNVSQFERHYGNEEGDFSDSFDVIDSDGNADETDSLEIVSLTSSTSTSTFSSRKSKQLTLASEQKVKASQKVSCIVVRRH